MLDIEFLVRFYKKSTGSGVSVIDSSQYSLSKLDQQDGFRSEYL